MWLALQLLSLPMGLVLMFLPVLRLGKFELARPAIFFVGMILALQFPLAIFVGAAAGASESLRASSQGFEFSERTFKKRWGWLDAAVTGGSYALALGIGLSQMRQKHQELFVQREEPVGIRDYVQEQRDRESELELRRAEMDRELVDARKSKSRRGEWE